MINGIYYITRQLTYDDAGNIIPLSKRDDFTNSDIRCAIAPLIGLSTIGKTKQAE